MTVRTHPTHAPSLEPRLCPGGQVVRLVSDVLDCVLFEHSLPATLTAEGIAYAADLDYDRALTWLEENPDDVVLAYTYSGDTGACDSVTFLAFSNVRDEQLGRPRTPIVRTVLNQCAPATTQPIPRRRVETRQLPTAVD